MKKLLLFLLLISNITFSQERLTLFKGIHVPNAKEQKALKGLKSHHDLLDIDSLKLAHVLKDEPKSIQFSLNKFNVKLERVESPKVNILTSDGKKYKIPKTVHYRGKDADFTFSEKELVGLITDSTGNYNIGKLDSSDAYVLAESGEFAVSGFECGTTSLPQYQLAQLTSSKCIARYIEADYDLFVAFHYSVADLVVYMQGVSNQTQTLYFNDGFNVYTKTIYVNTSPDKYTGTSTSSYLNQFGSYSPYIVDSIQKKTNSRAYGDVATLWGLYGGGGIAWTATLNSSNPSARMSYGAISTTYFPIPNYSWTVDCDAHELGHIVGSPHTHQYVWSGTNSQIDGCGTGCTNLPPLGGTIMSYCNWCSCGIKFSLGFGEQPSMLMHYYVDHSDKLGYCTIDTPIVVNPPTYTVTTPPTFTVTPPSNICKIDSIRTSKTSLASFTTNFQLVSGAVILKFYWGSSDSLGSGTGKNALKSVTASPFTASLSGNKYYKIWFAAYRDSQGTQLICTSEKVLIKTGTGLLYK